MGNPPDNQSIDARLRAYTTRRRQEMGDPFVLPPETRMALKAEIERRNGLNASPAAHSQRWFRWLQSWPVLAPVTGLVVLGVVALVWRFGMGRQNTSQLARAALKEIATPVFATPATSITSAGPSPIVMSAPAAPTQGFSSAKNGSNKTSRTFGTPAAARSHASLLQRFVQAPAAAVNTADRAPGHTSQVLVSFQIQEIDGKLRVVDADGSAYEIASFSFSPAPESEVQLRAVHADHARPATVAAPAPVLNGPAEGPALNMLTRSTVRAGAPPGQQPRPEPAMTNAIAFTALGTNRTLNQSVLLQGRILIPPEPAQQGQKPRDADRAGLDRLRGLLQNSTVQGRVFVAVTNQFELNAVPQVP